MFTRSAAIGCWTLLGLLLCLPATATQPKNPRLREYSQTRQRDGKGRFLPVPAANRAVRKAVTASGWANPQMTGQSRAFIKFKPATSTRAGSLEVVIPEYYTGNSLGGTSTARQLFGLDVRKHTAVVDGTLTIGRHSRYTSFGPARFSGTIAPGTILTMDGLKQALRGLHVNPLSVKVEP